MSGLPVTKTDASFNARDVHPCSVAALVSGLVARSSTLTDRPLSLPSWPHMDRHKLTVTLWCLLSTPGMRHSDLQREARRYTNIALVPTTLG